MRKGIDNDWIEHLDYFTSNLYNQHLNVNIILKLNLILVDFNEEYSALYGGYLEEQAQFLAQSIKTVLSLYRKLSNKPRSVVIVAHSMVFFLMILIHFFYKYLTLGRQNSSIGVNE